MAPTIGKAIVGIDAATEPSKVGLALTSLHDAEGRLEAAELGRTERALAETLISWLNQCDQAVIAIDAPLGWPTALGLALSRHQAGDALLSEAHMLFRRTTDRFVRERIGKQSLDVGADRIARTAFAALGLLNNLRLKLGDEVPLAWNPSSLPRWSVIEVYPAATLRSHRISDKGYKDPDSFHARREVVKRLQYHIDVAAGGELLERSTDALDAVICTLSGLDFMSGCAMLPDDLKNAKGEGWIWVRDPLPMCRCQSKVESE